VTGAGAFATSNGESVNPINSFSEHVVSPYEAHGWIGQVMATGSHESVPVAMTEAQRPCGAERLSVW